MCYVKCKNSILLAVMMALCLSIFSKDKTIIVGDWAIKLTPKPNNTLEHTDKPFDDLLTFKDGKLSSKVCSGYEFDASTFASKVVAGKTEYLSTMKSAKHGSAIWRFTINANKIEGTFNWDKDGKSAAFTFTGELKADDKK